jgi:hypothetical protein
MLADYTAGVLDPAESAVIADLVQTHPRWRDAHDALVAAEAAVLSDLHTAAADPLTMPADVADRIDAALAAERGHGVVVPIEAARSRRRPNRRVLSRVAAAAAGIVAVAGGLTVATQFRAQDIGSGSMAEAPAMDRGAPGEALSSGGAPEWDSSSTVQVVATGRDYSAATAPEIVREAAAVAPPAPAAPTAQSAAETPTGGAAKYSILADADLTARTAGGELARLAAPAALEACLTAVGSVISGTPSVVDFARYEGAPALIILVRQPSSSTIVVVGPGCSPDQPDVITTLRV